VSNFWNATVRAFHQTNHDIWSVANKISYAVSGSSAAYSTIRRAASEGVFDQAAIDGASAITVGAGIVAAPVAEGVAIGAASSYLFNFVAHLGHNMGWWGN